jgi:hypothetical protein
MKSLVLVVTLVALVTLTACGGGSMAIGPPPPQQQVLKADVSVSSATNGGFNVAMSTSFQPAEWDFQFFQQFPAATTPLSNLQPHHIRLQGISQGVPQTSPASWDFTVLDVITQPVLGVGDHSPEFQVAKAPPFMYTHNDANSFNDSFLDTTYNQFAAYAVDLVRYYNTGGFTSSDGVLHVSPAFPNSTITWWGIYNEPSINNFTTSTSNTPALDYTTMYNAVVPAMQSADPNIKFVALEMCCSSEDWATTFAQNVTPGLPVDVVATHYYSSCNQRDTDTQLFSAVPGFANSVTAIYNNLSVNAALTSVPVWITENNVNADFNAGNGMSACNPGQVFVTDKRGSSAFFAAWRPYVFSQVGKVGAQALYHWDFAADAEFGELDGSTGQTQLSYWVDYWIGQMFPVSSQQLLQFTNSDDANFEVLPVKNTDGSVVVMISNHAVASPEDNNGAGLSAKITLDVSALGNFASASLVMIDSSTSAATGPSPSAISASSPMTLNMNGYSVAFIKLQ